MNPVRLPDGVFCCLPASIIIDETSFHNDFPFCICQRAKMKRDFFQAAVHNIGFHFFCFAFNHFADFRNKDIVAVFKRKGFVVFL